MRIISVMGPTGAGKDTAADYLASKLGLPHVSTSAIVRGMLAAAGLEITKNALRDFGAFLRAQYSPDIVIKHALALQESTDGVVLSGCRSLAEADAVHRRGGTVIYIEADVALRHKRILERKRPGDILDAAHFAKFDQTEQGSHQNGEEGLAAAKAVVDYVIENNGAPAELYRRLDELVTKL